MLSLVIVFIMMILLLYLYLLLLIYRHYHYYYYFWQSGHSCRDLSNPSHGVHKSDYPRWPCCSRDSGSAATLAAILATMLAAMLSWRDPRSLQLRSLPSWSMQIGSPGRAVRIYANVCKSPEAGEGLHHPMQIYANQNRSAPAHADLW